MAELAARQHGRVSALQLGCLGVAESQVRRWVDQGVLCRELARVYRLAGSPASIEADLATALLYAGPGAMLGEDAAGWWVGAVRHRPRRICVATPRRCRSLQTPELFGFDGIDVRPRRAPERLWLPRDGRAFGRDRRTAPRMPLTPIPQLALDLAQCLTHDGLRRAIAQLEFRRLTTVADLRAACGRGRPGSALLAAALDRHQPRLALTRSPPEDRLILICEERGVELPETNAAVGGYEVDAVWRTARLIVEIDGAGNHGLEPQIRRDRERDLALRALGYLIIRYTPEQLYEHPDAVAADIRRHLAQRTTA